MTGGFLHPEIRFILNGKETESKVCEFWQWSQSDLLNNATRGVLAEYIVAMALGISGKETRLQWKSYDLETDDGIKIEVKSAAYLQSWGQNGFSRIVFSIAPARIFDYGTGFFEKDESRPSDVYVFCLLDSREKEKVNPLDLDQWKFYILSTPELERNFKNQKTVSLSVLLRAGAKESDFLSLKKVIYVCN